MTCTPRHAHLNIDATHEGNVEEKSLQLRKEMWEDLKLTALDLVSIPQFSYSDIALLASRYCMFFDSSEIAVESAPRLYPGGKFGLRGITTAPSPGNSEIETVAAEDGFSMLKSGSMYRSNEFHADRREPRFLGLHNLADSVLERTIKSPRPKGREAIRRAVIWDQVAEAFRNALAEIPSKSYVVVCSNSGPYNPDFEDRHPADFIPEATCGILLVAGFRGRGTNINKGWIQVAVPCEATDGRIFASLRLMPCVAGRPDLEFMITNLTNRSVPPHMINLPRKYRLPYGAVINSWRPTNLGNQYFSMGGIWEAEYRVFRNSFAWDGDLYGHDEAILYTRSPIIIISDLKPDRRFTYFQLETVLRGVTWLRLKDSVLQGSSINEMRREDAIRFDREGLPVELVYCLSSNPGHMETARRPRQKSIRHINN